MFWYGAINFLSELTCLESRFRIKPLPGIFPNSSKSGTGSRTPSWHASACTCDGTTHFCNRVPALRSPWWIFRRRLHRSKTDYALFFRIWKIGVLWHVLLAESLKDAILIEGKVLHAALGVEAAHTPDLAALDVGTETMAVEARGRAATHGLGGNVIREVVHDVYDAKFIRLVSSQA